jgi:prepilin-type N-terminal cleavage/methylation domain-containing protein
MKKNRFNLGVTLIEVLIAVSIVGFLGGVLYTTLAQGIRIWRLANRENPKLNFIFLLEKMNSDVRNSFAYSEMTFSGSPDSFEFYTAPPSFDTQPAESIKKPVLVRYYFDRNNRAINKTEKEFSTGTNSVLTSSENDELVADRISECQFEYYFYDKMSKSYYWKNSWHEPCFPYGIRLKLDYGDSTKARNLTRIISVPIGGACLKSAGEPKA